MTDVSSVELLGYAAACLTSASFFPQALLVIRTRRTDGISLLMYSMFTLGVALWLGYGILASARPVAIANAVTLILAGIVLFITAQERLSKSKPSPEGT